MVFSPTLSLYRVFYFGDNTISSVPINLEQPVEVDQVRNDPIELPGLLTTTCHDVALEEDVFSSQFMNGARRHSVQIDTIVGIPKKVAAPEACGSIGSEVFHEQSLQIIFLCVYIYL